MMSEELEYELDDNYYLYDDMLSYYGIDEVEDLYGEEDE
jgi:hypothetical protein